MGILALPEFTPLGLAEAEKEAVPPKSEESNKEESQQKQQETPVRRSPLPGEPEQGTPPLMVQLGLLRAETDRYSFWDSPIASAGASPLPTPPPFYCLLPSTRLRDVLAEKERECQALVQLTLQCVSGEARTWALASEPPGEWEQSGELEWWV